MRILIAGLNDQTQNYAAAVSASGMEPIVSLALPDDRSFSGIDGLLLPGGADIDPARYHQPLCGSKGIDPQLDEAQFAILDAFLKTGRPILGICKGHQILNVYFGGDLSSIWNRQISTRPIPAISSTPPTPKPEAGSCSSTAQTFLSTAPTTRLWDGLAAASGSYSVPATARRKPSPMKACRSFPSNGTRSVCRVRWAGGCLGRF